MEAVGARLEGTWWMSGGKGTQMDGGRAHAEWSGAVIYDAFQSSQHLDGFRGSAPNFFQFSSHEN